MLKMRRQNGGFNLGDFKSSLVSALKISQSEAEAIIVNPLVQKELAKNFS
jgi:hypothetical protein